MINEDLEHISIFDKIEKGIPQYKTPTPFITGYYGCKCHPFITWEELHKAQKQRFKIGDLARHRCSGKEGTVLEVDGHWTTVEGVGNTPAEQLIKITNLMKFPALNQSLNTALELFKSLEGSSTDELTATKGLTVRPIDGCLGATGEDVYFIQEDCFSLRPGQKVTQIGDGRENGCVRTDNFNWPIEYMGAVIADRQAGFGLEKFYAFEAAPGIYFLYGSTTYELFSEVLAYKRTGKTMMRWVKPAFKIIEEDKLFEFEIWSEGYIITGGSSDAFLLGKAKGKTFEEAVLNYKAGLLPKDQKLFNEDNTRYWGCKLFSNPAEAHKTFE